MNPRDRFARKLVETLGPDPCVLWIGTLTEDGYGRFYVDARRGERRRFVSAHRYAWEQEHGTVPDGKQVLHRCDVRNCVVHLFLGDNDANMADRDRKGRTAKGDRVAGSKLTEEGIRAVRLRPGSIREMAQALGVSKKTIKDILARRTWRHVA